MILYTELYHVIETTRECLRIPESLREKTEGCRRTQKFQDRKQVRESHHPSECNVYPDSEEACTDKFSELAKWEEFVVVPSNLCAVGGRERVPSWMG